MGYAVDIVPWIFGFWLPFGIFKLFLKWVEFHIIPAQVTQFPHILNSSCEFDK
jgi:hypothetical protein